MHQKNAVESTGKFWFPLDNAAKIYPAIISEEVTAVFRLTAVLASPVKIKQLRKAVFRAEKRYPYFLVQLKEGFFWYYLEHHPQHIPILPDTDRLCRKFAKDGLLLRFLIKDSSISAEFSHILTDGAGALKFLKDVLLLYFLECGIELPADYQVELSKKILSKEAYEDAYNRYFKSEIPPMVKKSKSYHLPYRVKTGSAFSRLIASVPIKNISAAASRNGVSITIYLVSVYLFTLQHIFENINKRNKYKKKKTIRIQVPVNLRNIFPSVTMRNFSLFVMPGIDLHLGHYDFEEIIKTVYHQVKLETDKKLINKNISRNVGSEKKIYVRGIPLFLKSFILRLKYFSLGISQYSGVITNLGKINLPAESSPLINHFVITPPPPSKILKINCGVAGFGDEMVLSFGNVTHSHEFEKLFLNFLQSQEIPVKFL